jgi:hypothetical protein
MTRTNEHLTPSLFPPQLHVFVRDWLSANSVVLKSRDGHVVIDSGYVRHKRLTLALLATERGIGDDSLAWLVNTHCHSDMRAKRSDRRAVWLPDRCRGRAPLVERWDRKPSCTTIATRTWKLRRDERSFRDPPVW